MFWFGGFFIALLVAVLVQSTLSGSKKKNSDVAMAQILVAAKNLSVGNEIVDGDMKWQEWPKDAVFNGAIMRSDEESAIGGIGR